MKLTVAQGKYLAGILVIEITIVLLVQAMLEGLRLTGSVRHVLMEGQAVLITLAIFEAVVLMIHRNEVMNSEPEVQ